MKKSFFSLVLFLSLAGLVNAQSSATDGLRVEVMVFSGRPNPVFVVTDPAQIREILSLVDTMPQTANADGRSVAKQGLGYRGIAVTNLSGDASGVAAITVYRSGVEVKRKSITPAKNAAAKISGGAAAEVRSDAMRALETRLLALAVSRGALDQRVVDQIKAK